LKHSIAESNATAAAATTATATMIAKPPLEESWFPVGGAAVDVGSGVMLETPATVPAVPGAAGELLADAVASSVLSPLDGVVEEIDVPTLVVVIFVTVVAFVTNGVGDAVVTILRVVVGVVVVPVVDV
jgi:hypothetical protein